MNSATNLATAVRRMLGQPKRHSSLLDLQSWLACCNQFFFAKGNTSLLHSSFLRSFLLGNLGHIESPFKNSQHYRFWLRSIPLHGLRQVSLPVLLPVLLRDSIPQRWISAFTPLFPFRSLTAIGCGLVLSTVGNGQASGQSAAIPSLPPLETNASSTQFSETSISSRTLDISLNPINSEPDGSTPSLASKS